MAGGSGSTSIQDSELKGEALVPALGRSPGRPRDQALTNRRREEIIETASRIFAEHGYRASDLNLVAERLGVSKGTIYNYFPSKIELFMACVELGKTGLHRAHQEAVAGAPDCPLAQIREAMQAYFQFFDQNPQHIELMMQARGEFKDNNLLTCPSECQTFAPLFDLLSRGVESGVIRPLSIKGMHDVLLNLVVGAIFSKHFGKGSESLSDQTAEILEIVFKGIVQEEPAKDGR
jgi:AcrR family transcriptional regulator